MIILPKRKSRDNLARYSVDGKQNEIIEMIRDEELKNPAPFSDNVLLIFGSYDMSEINKIVHVPEKLYETDGGGREDFVDDIPILKIAGIENRGNLASNYEYGMTFREVLFECLHGRSLTDKSLEYFLSTDLKANGCERENGFREFDQTVEKIDSKYIGRNGIGLTQRHGYFYCDQGKQRTIIAMFYIYQKEGVDGFLKKVRINRAKR